MHARIEKRTLAYRIFIISYTLRRSYITFNVHPFLHQLLIMLTVSFMHLRWFICFLKRLIWNSKLTNLMFQVTWVRRKDRHELLTVGRSTHSMDTRFVVANGPGWNLLIKNVRNEDAGLYECQVICDVYKKMCYFWYRGNKNGCNAIYA